MKFHWFIAALFVVGCASTPAEETAEKNSALEGQTSGCKYKQGEGQKCDGEKCDKSKCNGHAEGQKCDKSKCPHAHKGHGEGHKCDKSKCDKSKCPHAHKGHGEGHKCDKSKCDKSKCSHAHKGHGHKGMHKKFTNPEEWAGKWNSAEREAWQKPGEILSATGFAEGMTVADIGTGTGYFVPHLSKAVGAKGTVLALDIEQSMVDYVTKNSAEQKLTNVEVRKISVDGPGTDADSLDRIIIVNTWHHIHKRVEYGGTLLKTLKKGGKVVVVDFTKDSPMGPPVEHRLPIEKVEEELKAAGFTTEVLKLELPRQYVVVGTRP